MPKTIAATDNIYGYSGTDTMPGCSNVCWYAQETPFSISEDQLDFFTFKDGGKTYASNARDADLGSEKYTAKFFWYGAFAPTPTPKTPSANTEL